MGKIIVADTGPLIAFAYLDMFSMFPNVLGTVLVPDAVFNEVHFDPARPDTVVIQAAIDKKWLRIEQTSIPAENDFPPSLGSGEQAAIHLASEMKCPVLLDDKLARQFASSQGLTVIGTAGVLIKAKQSGEVAEVVPLLHTLETKGYYFSLALIDRIKEIAGE